MRPGPVLAHLLGSSEPSLRWKARVQVLGEEPGSRRLRALQAEVRRSDRVRRLLRDRDRPGRVLSVRDVYLKWQGFQWVLAHLADLGYPAGDPALVAMRDRVLELWLGSRYFREFVATRASEAAARPGVPVIDGRYRRCASQQGNALLSITRLGLDDGRGAQLAERLLHWQWPDGGWNCDRRASADTSSFMETLLPMGGLAAHAAATGSTRERRAARQASEVFLSRHLYRRRSDGRVIRPDFVRLHYPTYFHYDVLAGLRAMAAVGRIRDQRCSDALDLLEQKRLPDGGWPAESKYYRYSPRRYAGSGEFVDWGGTGLRRSNAWVTVDALGVLCAAGRLEP